MTKKKGPGNYDSILQVLGRSGSVPSAIEVEIMSRCLDEGVTQADWAAAYQRTIARGQPRNKVAYLADMAREERDLRLSIVTTAPAAEDPLPEMTEP